MTKKAVTIRDVARHAGVSVATASRALNGMDVVNPQTRDRILAVMEELGFTPSPAARRLSLGRTLTVGVVVSFLTRPQAAERLRGVDAVLTDSEFDLVIYNVESVQKRDHYLGTLAQSQRTDGLLVMSLPPPDGAVPTLDRSPVPVVFIDVHTPSIAAMPRVDRGRRGRWRARRAAPARPRPHGHRVRRRRGRRSIRLHLQPRPRGGLTRELARAGVAIPRRMDRTWRPRPIRGARPGASDARRSTDDRRPSSPRATPRRSGVIAAARELGLHVPDDLSVIGYDDIEAADYVGLTTIRQQLFESGRRGAEVLLAEIGDPFRGATGRPAGARAGGPCDHGASEGGPWMRAHAGLRTR